MLHQADGQAIEGAAAVEDLQQLEQQGHIQYQRHHAGHTGHDGAVVGKHLRRCNGAQYQIQHNTAEVTEDQGAHEIPTLTHKNDHEHREYQQEQRLGGAAVQFQISGDIGVLRQTHNGKEHGSNSAGDGGIGKTGTNHLRDVRLLRQGG